MPILPVTPWARAALVLVAAASLSPCAPAADPARRSAGDDLKFAREMASRGLWREAIFRWERALAALPPDSPEAGRVLNNVGVAAEALGQFDKARASYEKAAKLTGEKEVIINVELFRRAHPPPAGPQEGGRGPAEGAGPGSAVPPEAATSSPPSSPPSSPATPPATPPPSPRADDVKGDR